MTHLELLLELVLIAVMLLMHTSFTTLATVLEDQNSNNTQLRLENAQLTLENAQLKITTRMLGIVPALPA